MPKLTDLSPATVKTVPVRGEPIEVPGISLTGIAFLIRKYEPELKSLTLNDKAGLIEQITTGAPAFLAAIIAAGTGEPGDAKAEAVVARLSLEPQVALLAAIFEETMPAGIGPFVKTVRDLWDMLKVDDLLADLGISVPTDPKPSPQPSIS